jgi:hypothetical protein
VNPEWHYARDKLGFFAITCAKPTLKAILELLKQQNQQYYGSYDRHFNVSFLVLDVGTYADFLQFDEPPLSTAQYELGSSSSQPLSSRR